MSGLRELYTQVIMDHYQRPRNWGEIEGADLQKHLTNPLCGDEVTVYADFEDGSAADVRFTGRGCSISLASASMMTERLAGKSREEVEGEINLFSARMRGEEEFPEMEEMAALKGVIKYPSRIKCATLAWSAFREGLEQTPHVH